MNNINCKNPLNSQFNFNIKQYNNFCFEFVEEIFNDSKFNDTITCKLWKIGSLLGKIILKIEFPDIKIYNENIELSNNLLKIQFTNIYNDKKIEFDNTLNFYELIYDGINKIISLLLFENVRISNIIYSLNAIMSGTNLILYNQIIWTIIYKSELYKFDLYKQIIHDNLFIDSDKLYDELKNYIKYIKIIIMKNKQNTILYLNKLNKYINYIDKTNFRLIPKYNFGINLIKKVELIIGENIIEWFDNDFINIMNNIIISDNKDEKYDILVNWNKLNNNIFYINLPFWFTLNPDKVLPIFALLYNDINIKITFNSLYDCLYYDNELNNMNIDLDKIIIPKISLLVQYYYIEEKEIKYLSHNLLIQNIIFQSQNLLKQIDINDNDVNIIYDKLWQNLQINVDFYGSTFLLCWVCQPSILISKFKLNSFYDSIICYEILSIDIYDDYNINITIKNHCFKKYDKIKIFGTYHYDNIYIIENITMYSIIVKEKFVWNSKGMLFLCKNDEIYINNSIENCKLYFQNYNYFNFDKNEISIIRTNQYFKNWIDKSINIYNFDLFPFLNYFKNYSGTCDFTNIKNKILEIKLSEQYIWYLISLKQNYPNEQHTLDIKLYALSYNIINIWNGFLKIEFE